MAPGFFTVIFRTKVEMSMRISTAQARTKCLAGFALFRRCSFTSAPCSFLELCLFHLAGAALSGHFEVWNVILRDRCRTSGTFTSAWQAWHFLHVALKTLAGVGQNERWFWMSCFMAGAAFGELGCCL